MADYVISVGTDNAATLEPGASVTCWTADTGGTQYTDLTDTDEITPIADGILTADANGAVPEFYGPDDVTEMYLDANAGAGPRRRTLTTEMRAYTDDTFLPLVGGELAGTVTSVLATSTTVAAASIVDGLDVFDRFRRDASGRMTWGSGAATRDTSLYRDAADSLKTDDSLTVALTFRHLGTTAGFFGEAAVARPTVSGSWSDGSAGASLAAALDTLGLITDNTTA
ncbi:hypothetical protein ACFWM5_00660 [Streptomyces bobili]|uniref:hypothetical protein n=1 Tax=Streptomyces bobili TaxID=67280 RepID=UPI003658D769